MSINGIGNSASSWAQFVRISQEARERTAGNAVSSNDNRAEQNANANAISFKRMADMYLSNTNQATQAAQTTAIPVQLSAQKSLGGLFDAYA